MRDNLSQNDKRIIVEIVQTLYNMDHCPLCTHCERHGCTYAKRPGEINRLYCPWKHGRLPTGTAEDFEITKKILAWNVQRILEGVNGVSVHAAATVYIGHTITNCHIADTRLVRHADTAVLTSNRF